MVVPAFATADVVVVGAGSAGCVAAARLARDRSRTVLLLDAGSDAMPDPSQTRLTHLPIEPGAPRVRRYPESRGRDVVRGAGLGGSSVVNGGYFLRGHRDDYATWPWPIDRIEAEFASLEQVMSVSAFADDELGTVATAFEAYWGRAAVTGRSPRAEDSAWPTVGLNRVRSNRRDGRRFTAADAFLTEAFLTETFLAADPAAPRPGLRVVGDCPVDELLVAGGRVTGVHTALGRVDAPAVVLAAGALGSAALLLPFLGPDLPVHEHAERLVRFAARRPVEAPALLQTVLHTADALEIRCYGDDFAAFINGVPASGIAVGVADMGAGTRGSITSAGVDLGVPDAESLRRIDGGVDLVREMLHAPELADLVVSGSVRVDENVGMSSHAWGTVPLGLGRDIDGLHVLDGAALPGPLRSGPHASVMAMAGLIAAEIS